MKNNPFDPPQLAKHDNKIRWAGLRGSSRALAIAQLAIKNNQPPLLIITKDIQQAQQFQQELEFFLDSKALPIYLFPDWETLPYDHFSPHQDLISERLYCLSQISLLEQGIIIIALPTLMHRLMPRLHLQAHSLIVKNGDKFSFTALREQLATSGYHHVTQVMEHGEFAIRGAIMDIFPMGTSLPFRIELFDDEVESIRSFSPDDQRSLENLNEIRVLPAREFPLTQEGIQHFRQSWRARFAGNPLNSIIYERISAGEAVAGVEYYLPLFYDELATFFDYLPTNSQLILQIELASIAENFFQEAKNRHYQLSGDILRPLCEPNELFINTTELFSLMKNFQQIQLMEAEDGATVIFETMPPLTFNIDYHSKNPWQPLQNFLNEYSGKVLFNAESAGRREVLLDILHEINIKPQLVENWQQFIESKNPTALIVKDLEEGLSLPDPALTILTESQLFGQQVKQRRLREVRKQDPENIIRHLAELQIGAPVVHIDYGVGRYLGLQLIKTEDQQNEYLTLEYADADKIYVPVTALHLISRYTGADSNTAPLHKLGSKQWQTIKNKVAKQVNDTAAELLDVYSKREATTGFVFEKPDKDFFLFRQSFPFEETADQKLAIDRVIEDMTSNKCMDRLVCGDVGFGKTEVAMQAAFLAVNSGKQVALLVPTTLLAHQHVQTFKDRMADWPFKIEELSRLRSSREQKITLKNLTEGQVDIVIGTHKLLGSEIKFKNLGLLIVDEEHRFGVKQKEKIKALRAHVDILTLTATPIPRTLNMALAGMRDLSIIATPPAKRLAIKTFVHEYQPSIIREAILREILRGGQIFYLHNEVATIQTQAEKILKILPDLKIGIAHGQMHENELEKVMADFYHQRYGVLLCTTIIESGIDVPSANTIIINSADRFGLAQLHQLRGRVGRSHHQAYAYLLVNNKKNLTKDAEKRLEAISQLEDLGAGFHLATHDLEIRGAGELLGEEQSGHIQEIGFSLYMEMLENAVKALKANEDPMKNPPLPETTEVNLHVSAFIPETYIDDVNLRLSFYKQLSNCKDKEKIQDLKASMVDRFGNLPESIYQLFNLSFLKLEAKNLGIKKIDANAQFAYLHFYDQPKVNPSYLIKLIQQQSQTFQLQSNNLLRYRFPKHEAKDRYQEVQRLLNKLKEG